jgi:hypothetical protein
MKIKYNQINQILFQFCHDVINEPLCFFSEADLQAMLYKELNSKFSKPITTNYNKGPNSKEKYQTYQVHREYGVKDKPYARMDLVIFSEASISKINNPNLTIKQNNKEEYLVPEVGIEMGTHKTTDYKKHLDGDIEKLNGLNRGYLVYIMREESLSSTYSKRGQDSKEKIEKDILTPTTKTNFPANITPLIFLVRIQKQEKIWGKCKFYNPVINDWEPINLKDIYDKLNQLF